MNQKNKKRLIDQLVGNSNETEIIFNNLKTCLVVTGSCVSTVNQVFLTEYCADIIIQPLDQLIEVECASRQTLPYSGFIEAPVEISGVPNATQQYFFVLSCTAKQLQCKSTYFVMHTYSHTSD
jgi:hypothetical protein